MGRGRRGGRRGAGPQKPPLTHFLCVPLVNSTSRPQLEKALQGFRQDVSTIGPEDTRHSDAHTHPAIHPKAIRPTGSLHLTLGVMGLSAEQLAKATELLARLDIASLLGPLGSTVTQGISVTLQGLESMHAPEQTSILYTVPADATERLYPLCLSLHAAFKKEGLLVEDDRQLKLHATIVNTIYAKGRGKLSQRPITVTPDGKVFGGALSNASGSRAEGHGPNANAPLKIDARGILAQYKDYIWADSVTLDRLAICEMGAKKVLDEHGDIVDECYNEVASVPLAP